MSKVRETRVERDVDGNVVGSTEIERPKKKGGFGWGMLLGILIVAGAIIAFAYNQGSFQTAGARADQATQTAQVDISQTANNANDAAHRATDGNPNTKATDNTSN
jgi:hypothetical protein